MILLTIRGWAIYLLLIFASASTVYMLSRRKQQESPVVASAVVKVYTSGMKQKKNRSLKSELGNFFKTHRLAAILIGLATIFILSQAVNIIVSQYKFGVSYDQLYEVYRTLDPSKSSLRKTCKSIYSGFSSRKECSIQLDSRPDQKEWLQLQDIIQTKLNDAKFKSVLLEKREGPPYPAGSGDFKSESGMECFTYWGPKSEGSNIPSIHMTCRGESCTSYRITS